MGIFSDSENLLPDPSWDLERLASYAKERFELAGLFGKKTALQLWRAGQAILIVKEKLKAERKWTVWAQEHDLPLTSVYEAIKIAKRFEAEADITGLTTIEAKMIAGTVKPRARKETKGDDFKSGKGVTSVTPRDEKPVGGEGTPDAKTDSGSNGGGTPDAEIGSGAADEDQPDSETQIDAEEGTLVLAADDWFERLREELREEIAGIEDTVLFVQEWADRQDHPLSAALLRVLIESEQITVVIDEGKEVVRVDDHEMIAALAAAETFLDPIFARLGITPEIAARHLLEMIREGRGFAAMPSTAKPRSKKTWSK